MMHTKIMDPEAIHIVSPQQTPEENLKPFSNLPKPKKPSLLIVILVLIAAIALATTFYFANQVNKLKKETPASSINPTVDNWIQHTDRVLNFSIRYPPGWYLYPASPEGFGSHTILTNYDTVTADPDETGKGT